MTEKYTPEKVAELVAEARKLLFSDSAFGYEDTKEGDLIFRLAAALESVYADSLTAQAEHARWQERAWDEGQKAGLLRADFEYGAIGYQHVKGNPYTRKEQ